MMNKLILPRNIRISDDVVSKIAAVTAMKTQGIIGMSSGISEGITKRISGRHVQKGVEVEVGQYETAIDLRVIVQYSLNVHEICRELQENVKESVELLTGLSVVEVNVKVEGVSLPEEIIS